MKRIYLVNYFWSDGAHTGEGNHLFESNHKLCNANDLCSIKDEIASQCTGLCGNDIIIRNIIKLPL